MTIDKLDERALDRLCWLLVSTRNRFYPPDETAEECIEHFEEESDETRGHEHGYHAGMFTARNMFMEQLYGYGINVLARANRYTHSNRLHGMEFRLDGEPDYYRAVDGGAELTALRWRDSDLMHPNEIENIEWPAPYTPRGAESGGDE